MTGDLSDAKEQLLRRMLSVFASGDIEEAQALVAPDYVDHQDDQGGVTGRSGFIDLIRTVHALYPDLVLHVDDVIAAADRVVARVRWEGTRQSDGMPINAESIDIVRFAAGQAIEHWGISKGWD